MAPIEWSCQRSRLWGGLFIFSYDCNFLSYRFPPLRHLVTPLLKERLFVWLQLRGASNAVTVGWIFHNFHTSLLIFLTYHKYIVHMGLCPRRPFLSNLFLSVGTITLVAPFMFSHLYGQ